MSAKQILIQLFQLPPNEIIFQDYSCALKKGVQKYGRIFISENHICFFANIGGTKIKLVIQFDNISSIDQKSKQDIEITTKDSNHYIFASFSDRDQVYQLMFGLFTGLPVNMTLLKDSTIIDNGPSDEIQEGINIQTENAEVEVSFLNADGKNADEEIELMKVVLPVSLDKFFEMFLSEEAVYSFHHHRTLQGDTDTQISKWQPLDENPGSFQREIKSVMKLTDVPFRDKSRFHKIQTYSREGNKIIFKQTSHTLDIPYANYFQAEEKWELIEQEPNKCQIRCFGWIVFVKSTYMKKLITQKTLQSIQGYKDDYEKWIANVKKKIDPPKQAVLQSARNSSTHEYESISDQKASQLIELKKKQQSKNNNKKKFSFFKNIKIMQLDSLLPIALIGVLFVLLLLVIIEMLMLQNISSRITSLETFIYTNTKVESQSDSDL